MPEVSWQVLTIIFGVGIYIAYAASKFGTIQQQVESTTKEIGEAKLATAQLASDAVKQQQVLAEANTILRERVARLEEQMERKK
jgi:hypothetical protein